MPTMVSFTAGTPILSADVNANFTAVAPAMTCIYSSTASGVAVGTAATDLKTFSMAANTLTATGSGLRVSAQGYFGADALTKTLTFACGTAFASLNPTTTAPNDKGVTIDLWVIRTGASNCLIQGLVVLQTGTLTTGPALEAAGIFGGGTSQGCGAFSSAMTVRMIGQMANAASELSLTYMSVWAYNPP